LTAQRTAQIPKLARDADRTHTLEQLGFHVIRVTNIDVYENLEGVLEMICNTLRNS